MGVVIWNGHVPSSNDVDGLASRDDRETNVRMDEDSSCCPCLKAFRRDTEKALAV